MSQIKITRTQAAKIIERLREEAAEGDARAKRILDSYGIEPLKKCTGFAHTPDGCFVDNCTVCAPRWGWVGDKIKVT